MYIEINIHEHVLTVKDNAKNPIISFGLFSLVIDIILCYSDDDDD